VANDKKFITKNGIITPNVEFANGAGIVSGNTTFGNSVSFSNTITLNNKARVAFKTLNGNSVFMEQQNDDNFVFYTTTTTGAARPVFSVYANTNTSNLSVVIPLQLSSTIVANSSTGSAGQVLTSSGSGVYWGAAGASANNASFLNGRIWETAGAIGSTVANTGAFTTLTSSGATRIGQGVTQAAPSATDILSTAHASISGQGGNLLTFGQYDSGSGFAQWIQSSFNNPTTAVYNIVLQPLGGNVAIGSTTAPTKLYVNGHMSIANGFGLFANGTLGANGLVLTSNGSSLYWGSVSASGGGFTGNTVSANSTIIRNQSYAVNAAAGWVTMTLPSTVTTGDIFIVHTYGGNTRILNNSINIMDIGTGNDLVLENGETVWLQAVNATAVDVLFTYPAGGTPTIIANSTFATTANNALFVYGKQESQLSVASSNTALFLQNRTWETAGAIGATVANTGAFTTLTTTGSIQQQNANYLSGRNSSGGSTRLFGINSANTLYVGAIDTQLSETLFVNNGVEQMRIQSSGNVSIGSTITPTRLFVNGHMSIANGFGLFANGTLGANGLVLTSNGTSLFWGSIAAAANATFSTTANNALFANSASFVYGKQESQLSVANAVYAQSSNSANFANAAAWLGGFQSSYYTNATNITTGTLPEAQLPFRMNQNVRTTDNVTFANLTITGSVTVTGNVTTWSSNNLNITDNMIYLNSNSQVANPDLGFAANYNDGTYRHTGFFRDATDGVWKVFDQYLPEPDASPYIDTANLSFRIADFQANVVNAASVVINNSQAYRQRDGTGTVRTLLTTLSDSSVVINGFQGTNMINGVNGATYLYGSGAGSTVMTLTSGGNAGIGNTTPGQRLQVDGSVGIKNGLVANGTFGTAGFVLTSNGSVVYWANASSISGTVANANNASFLNGRIWETAGAIGATVANTGAFTTLTASANVNIDSGVLFVDGTSNRVGVNITTPLHAHHVSGSVLAAGDASSVAYYMNDSQAIRSSGTMYIDADTSGQNGFTRAGTGDLIFRTAAAQERMRIISGGNIGIGNTTPGQRLQVDGSVGIKNGLVANGSFGNDGFVLTSNGSVVYWANASSISGTVATANNASFLAGRRWETAGAIGSTLANTGAFTTLTASANVNLDSGVLFVDSTTNSVGINTTTPSIAFQVGNRGGFGSDGVLYWGQDFTSGNRGFLSWNANTASVNAANTLIFGTNTSVERMRITNLGNVGIGNTNPERTFHVTSTGLVSTLLQSTTSSSYLDIVDGSNNYLRLGSFGGVQGLAATPTTTPTIAITSTGRVGINTNTPQTPFVVSNAGAGGLEFDGSTGLIQSYNRGTSAYQTMLFDAATIVFRPSGTEAARITATGNVAIGSTAAPTRLFVNGHMSVANGFGLFANGTLGANGLVLTSNGTSLFWGSVSSGTATTANNANFLQERTWATPFAIGATVANTGAFTTLTTTQSGGFANTVTATTGQVISHTTMNGGRTYFGYDLNTQPALYETRFVNISASTNIPSGMSSDGYWFGMGAGDTTNRGFSLMGTTSHGLWFRTHNGGSWTRTVDTTNIGSLTATLAANNASFLNGRIWETAGAIGSTVANTGAFTTLIARPNQTGAIAAVQASNNSIGMFIVPNAGSGAYNNLVSAGDNLIYFSNNTINGGNLVIGAWTDRASGYGIRFSNAFSIAVVSNTFVMNANTTINGNTFFNRAIFANGAIGANGLVLTSNGNGVFWGSVSAGGGTTTNAVTFNNSGSGAASGTTFDGSAARTISYNTVGAPSTTGTNASGTWGISISGISTATSGQLQAHDIRTIAPSAITAPRAQFGFTSFNNNNTSPYADFFHLRSYSDSSGGNDNLVMFRKDAIGMRIYQQTYGSATAYSSFKDIAFTDGTNASGSWGISVTGSSASTTGNAATATALQTARTINGVSFNGTANITVAVAFNDLTSKASGTGTYTTSGDFRAPIFYDSDNTGYYVNPLGTTNLLGNLYVARDGTSNDTFGGLEVREYSYAGAATGAANEAPGINFHWSLRAAARIYMNNGGHFVFGGQSDITNNRRDIYFASSYAATDSRAPIFYDSNNTAYFADPNSNSRLFGIFVGAENPYIYGVSSNHLGVRSGASGSEKYFRFDSNGYLYTLNGGVIAEAGDIRAPIFYDQNDTTVRWDAGTFVLRSGSPTVYFRDTDHNSAMIHVNSNIFYVLRGGNDTESWTTVGSGSWPLEINLTNNNAQFGGIVTAITDMRSPIFYDSQDTGWYCDPNGTSKFGQVGITTPPTASSYLNIGGYNAYGGTGYNGFLTIYNSFGSATNPYQYWRLNAAGGWEIVNSAYNAVLFTFTQGGDFTAAGNVTAYSDRKLKDNFEPISDAVNKVLQLNGVTFTRIDKEDTAQRYAGLIAQDVEPVLPEAVQKNDTMSYGEVLSVDYNGTIALLVEAIKEQQAHINRLEQQINSKRG